MIKEEGQRFNIDLGVLKVLVVDDIDTEAEALQTLVKRFGVEKTGRARTVAEAGTKLKSGEFNCATVDWDMDRSGRGDGMQILRDDETGDIFKIMLTGHPQAQEEAALFQGALRFLTKNEISARPERLNYALRDAAVFVQHRLPIVYQSEGMVNFYREVSILARRGGHVLILGESGSGKELAARAIHKWSGRDGKLVTCNSAGLNPSLWGWELFGSVKGAWHGAENRPGIFESAHRGTVFLDEISLMAPDVQHTLLRFLEDPGELHRVGAEGPVRISGKPVDVRCVFASDKHPGELVNAGKFNGPLFQRLSAHILKLPALNDHRDDIPLLARRFLRAIEEDTDRLSSDALRLLCERDWTGSNVRGLKNVIERLPVKAMMRTDDEAAPFTAEDVKLAFDDARILPDPDRPKGFTEMLTEMPDMTMAEWERAIITETLRRCGDNASVAARKLQIGRTKIQADIKKYGLRPDRDED